MSRYNNNQKQQLHTYIYTHTRYLVTTHISWWLVLGWVTTKKEHPHLRITTQTLIRTCYSSQYIVNDVHVRHRP